MFPAGTACEFESEVLSKEVREEVLARLDGASDKAAVKEVFRAVGESAKEWDESKHSRDESGRFAAASSWKQSGADIVAGDSTPASQDWQQQNALLEQMGEQKLGTNTYLHDIHPFLAAAMLSEAVRLDEGRGLLRSAYFCSHGTLTQGEAKPDYAQVFTTWSSPQEGVMALTFNERAVTSPERLTTILEQANQSGQTTIKTIKSLVRHEWGHVLEHTQADNGQALRQKIESETKRRLQTGEVGLGDWRTACGGLVFKNQALQPAEQIAEAYRLHLEAQLPSRLNYMADILKEFGIIK